MPVLDGVPDKVGVSDLVGVPDNVGVPDLLGVNVVPVPDHVPPTVNVDAEVELEITPLEKLTFPETVRLPPLKSNLLDAPLNVKLLQLPLSPEDNAGQLPDETVVGMVTFVEEVGTPPHQLDAVFQSVLVTPSQVPFAVTVTAPETGLVNEVELEFVITT